MNSLLRSSRQIINGASLTWTSDILKTDFMDLELKVLASLVIMSLENASLDINLVKRLFLSRDGDMIHGCQIDSKYIQVSQALAC